MTQTVVPPEEIFRVTASIPVDRPELEPLREAIRQGSWEVEVRYGNIDEDDSVDLVTTLSISGTRVRQVAFRWADDDEPFLISGPADD
ncbi:MAG TPA: hypothetical protein VEB69_00540 [Acidimicrobiia bacterium]|nr:hypothetical protein [Acidimicrobiia bacterium]